MWDTPENFSVKIGGNFYTNCKNLIVAGGESLFRIRRRDDGQLGVDFDIYDKYGAKVATVRNGNIVENHLANAYAVVKEARRYIMTERATGRVVCSIEKSPLGQDGSELDVSVDLYTNSGVHVVASPTSTSLRSIQFTGCRFADCDHGLVID